MSISVVDFGAYGIYSSSHHDFSYSNLNPGDLLILTSVNWQGLSSWTINGNSLTTNGVQRDYLQIAAPTGGVWDADIRVMQYYGGSEPSSGTLRASNGLGVIGGAQYFILHDDGGTFGERTDYLGIDIPALDHYTDNSASGSHALTVGSRAAAFPGEQLQLAIVGARFFGATYLTTTVSSPSGMTSTQGLDTTSDHVIGFGGYELAGAGTVPSRSSTVTWSLTGVSHFVDTALTTPVLYFAPRHEVTVHKTLQPNMDAYYGPADPTDWFLEIFDNTPSGFPYFGPILITAGVDGDIMYVPDNNAYNNWNTYDNGGADWGGFEASSSPSTTADYDVTDISGDGGNVVVGWTSGNSFTLQVSGDGDIYVENTFTGTTPVTGADHWGILSGDP